MARGGGSFGGLFSGGPAGPSLGNERPNRVPSSGGRAYGGGSSRGCGCLTAIVVLILVGTILAAFFASRSGSVSNSSGGSTEITKSTVACKALPRGSVNETGYYGDELGWIANPSELLAGLKHFHQKTGVQPYLYITNTISGSHSPSVSDLDEAANSLYDKLFTDETHLLLVFFEYDNSYMDRYVCGTQAKTIIDNEAADILLDYVDRYYYDDDFSEEAFFSKAFSDAANRIMDVTRSPWILVSAVLGVVALTVVVFAWWRHAINQKNVEAKQTEEMLKTPLEKFGDMEMEELTKKYEDAEGRPDHLDLRRQTMGILDRFNDIIKANINALILKMEDPSKMIDESLRDMIEDLAEVKRSTAGVRAEETRTQRLVDQNQAQVVKYADFAKKALVAGNDGDARTFIAKKQELEDVGVGLMTAYAAAHENALKMRQMHDKLASDIDARKSRREIIKAKVTVARTQETLNEATAAIGRTEGAMNAFGRMEDKASKMLDEANAMAQLNMKPIDAAKALEEKYATKSTASVDEDLDRVKVELGL